MSYGLARYGIGTAALTALYITGARCLTTQTVQVTLSAPPQALSDLLPGDVLNPLTWQLTEVVTGSPFTILVVDLTDATTVVLHTQETLADFRTMLRVHSADLLRVDGYPISPPTFADFPGLQAEQDSSSLARQAAQRLAPVDLRSPQTSPGQPNGALIIGPSGDYESEAGAAALVRKLVFRRLYTVPGDFWYLPLYGIGLAVKQTVAIPQLIKLKQQIKLQVLREPEVADVVVGLSQLPDGTLNVNLNVTLQQTGESVPMSLAVNPNLVQL